MLAAVILAAWLASLAWLVRRELGPGVERAAAVARRVPPSASFYSVELGGRRVGLASTTVDTTATGLHLVTRLLPFATDPAYARALAVFAELALDEAFDVDRFVLRAGTRLEGPVLAGRFAGDSALVLELPGRARPHREPLAGRRPMLPVSLPLQLTFAPRRDDPARLAVFDPLGLAWDSTLVEPGGDAVFVVPDRAAYDSVADRWVPAHADTVRARRVDLRMRGVPVALWIDAQGRLVAQSTPLGVQLRRTEFELANDSAGRAPLGRPEPGEPVPLPLAAPPRDDRPLERLVVVVAGPGGARPRLHQYALHDDPRQEIRGDTLIVSRRGRADERPADPRRHLAPDPLVPSDDPAIRAAARALVAPRPEETAARIVRWVDREVVRAPSDRVVLPDAAGALRRGRGTDQERLLVMVALARAAGIPARTVGGLLLRGDRFHWHAWAELHLDGWVPADPYTGQLPADAARVRLVVGGLGRPAELFPLFGGMRLRVVERRETR